MLKDAMTKSQSGSLIEVARSLFDRDKRRKWITEPTPVGGFKEYYENVQALAHNASLRLTVICNELESKLEGHGILTKTIHTVRTHKTCLLEN